MPQKPSDGPARIPTISRVLDETLVELVYQPEDRKTALIVSRNSGLWNVEQELDTGKGEILIPYSATNNLVASQCVLLPSQPVEYRHRQELAADVRAFLHRYVGLSPLMEEIAAHYVLLTWVYDRFGELPYLRFRGDFGTGKTRALTVLGSLCYKAFFASGASTVSPIFHILDIFGGTLVLDEADLSFSDAKAHLVKILNNGTVHGMPVLRTLQNRHKELNPRAFKVYGPKIIAMRDRFADEALESRFLTEETGQYPLRNDIPLHLPASFKAEALELRNRLLHFRLCEYFKIETDPSVVMKDVDPRLNQTALSLLSVVDDPATRAQIQEALKADHEEMLDLRRESVEAAVLAAALEAFSKARNSVAVGEITARYNAARKTSDLPPASSKFVGHILRTRLHLKPRRSHGVFAIPASAKSKLEALAERYGVIHTSQN